MLDIIVPVSPRTTGCPEKPGAAQLALRWSELDLARRTACLGDTKTGASMRPLARPVIAILDARERHRELVFPASRGDGSLTGFTAFWERVMTLGDVPRDITPHVLRHSFASIAADLGYAESTIAALIGHRSGSITARYIHSADAVLLGAADRIAAHIQQLMKPVGPKRARRRRIEVQGLAVPSVP